MSPTTRSRLQSEAWGVVVVGSAALVGATAVGASPMVRLMTLALLATVSVLLVVITPRIAVWFAVVAPALELVSPVSTWRLAAIGLMLVACAASWHDAHRRARWFALLLGATVAWIFVTAFVLDPVGPDGFQSFLGIFYGVGLAATVALAGMTSVQCEGVLAAWGSLTAVVALSNPTLIEDRGEALIGENANGLGTICALGLVAAFSGVVWSRRLLHWGSPVVVLCGLGLFATGSRGALLTAVLGVATVVLIPLIRRGAAQAVAVTLGVSGVAAWGFSGLMQWFTSYVGRDESSFENVTAREDALTYALRTGLAHPWSGVGLGRLNIVSYQDGTSRLGLRAHNTFVGIFAESGALALGLVLGIMLLALGWSLLQAPRQFPLVVAVAVAGLSIEWWGTARLGVLVLLVIGVAVSQAGTRPEITPTPRTASSSPHLRR